MKLNRVRVNKLDSCLTYVMARVPNIYNFRAATEIPISFYKAFDVNNVYVGQILVWKSARNRYLWNTEIMTSEDGKPCIIANNEYVGMHFGVVEFIQKEEGEDPIITISDCVRNHNAYSYPTIGLATICLKNEAKSKTEVGLPAYILDI